MPLLTLLLGYLLGSIPSGFLAGKWCKGIDLRTIGSGSTGATNVLRNVGKNPALVVFLVDVAKGAAAVLLASALTQNNPLNDWIQVMAGLAALAGHIWPVWLGFKGGKVLRVLVLVKGVSGYLPHEYHLELTEGRGCGKG